MATSLEEEMSLFSQIALAIGETVENVCNMQEKERNDLISVLGLESQQGSLDHQLLPFSFNHTGLDPL